MRMYCCRPGAAARRGVLVHFSVLVLSDECDESDELLVTVISIQ